MSKADPSRRQTTDEPRLSRASAARFSLYLRPLERLHREGIATVSSSQLGEAVGITDAQVRKDLAYLGNLGHPGVGYPTLDFASALRRKLGIDRAWAVVLIGVGNLARALLRYRGFAQQGFRIVAVFDCDPAKIGQEVEGLQIHGLSEMPAVVASSGAELALLTVPTESAQGVAEALGAAGIRGILNFAPLRLKPPPGVSLVSVDLAVQLEQLAFLVQLEGGGE